MKTLLIIVAVLLLVFYLFSAVLALGWGTPAKRAWLWPLYRWKILT